MEARKKPSIGRQERDRGSPSTSRSNVRRKSSNQWASDTAFGRAIAIVTKTTCPDRVPPSNRMTLDRIDRIEYSYRLVQEKI